MATLLSGHSDLPTTRPAVDTSVPNDVRWAAPGSIARPEQINDIYAQIRHIASYLGVDITTFTRGDVTVWRQLFQELAGLSFVLPTTAGYLHSPDRGYQPLLRGINVGPNISTADKWGQITGTTDVVNGDVLYDAGGVNRSNGDNVLGSYAGVMSTGIWNIDASGNATRHSVSGGGLDNQAVYLSPTSDSIGFAHCLIEDVHVSRRSRLRYIGRVLLTAPTPNSVVVAYNTLKQPEVNTTITKSIHVAASGAIAAQTGGMSVSVQPFSNYIITVPKDRRSNLFVTASAIGGTTGDYSGYTTNSHYRAQVISVTQDTNNFYARIGVGGWVFHPGGGDAETSGWRPQPQNFFAQFTLQ